MTIEEALDKLKASDKRIFREEGARAWFARNCVLEIHKTFDII